MKPKRDFALEVYFSRWEFKVRYNVGGSDLQSLTLSQLLELAEPEDRRQWDNLLLGYTESFGSPELREVMADTYENIDTDNILTFAGAQEAIFCTMNALLKSGDHALVCYPNYQSVETVPAGICATTGIPLDPEKNWTLDIDYLCSQIRPNTKLIAINFPNNPTGKILERAKFETLVRICRKEGIYLFSDEVYRLIERAPGMRLPQAADLYERGLSLNVMSKAYGMAGLRIGWIASQDRSVLLTMERVKHYLSICNSGPSEMLAKIALKARDRILAANRKLVANNLSLLDEFFQQHSGLFDWQIPDGGCVGFPIYRGKEGVEKFTRHLIDDAGLMLVPASIYRSDLGAVPDDHFRIGFGRKYFPEALDVLRAYLEKQHPSNS